MKTAELEGAKLDYWVAKALGESQDLEIRRGGPFVWSDGAVAFVEFHPSTNWEHGGPIIERERIATAELDEVSEDGEVIASWFAFLPGRYPDSIEPMPRTYIDETPSSADGKGPTPLIAAMRAFVASKFGGEVPDA